MIAAACKAVVRNATTETGALSHERTLRQAIQIENDLLALEREECVDVVGTDTGIADRVSRRRQCASHSAMSLGHGRPPIRAPPKLDLRGQTAAMSCAWDPAPTTHALRWHLAREPGASAITSSWPRLLISRPSQPLFHFGHA
jgi:hypothetical protein